MDEIKKLLGSDKLLIGKERTLKALRKGSLRKIFLASNTNKETANDVNHYAALTQTEVIVLEMKNEEIGTMCRKSFSISVLGVLK